MIQTETGAREGVLTAKQIDNLSVIGRSALELMRILPGVVTEFNQGESVSFGGGGNNTQGYTVNGIRSSGNTVSLDGSSLIDIGSNSGVIVSLNNDMVQEVKVQSSNFAAEYGTGGMNVSGVTKSGSSKFHGSVYDYWRDYKFAANDRSNSIAGTAKPKSTYQYPGGNVGGPIAFGDSYTKNRDRLFFFVAYESAAAAGRLRLALHAHLLAGDAQRRLQRAARQPRLEPEQHPAAAHSEGLPERRASRRRTTTCAPYMHADRHGTSPASIRCRTTTTRPTSTTTSTARSSRTTATTSRRASTGTSATAPRPTSASRSEGETAESPRGVWWAPEDVVALPTPNIGENRGRSYAGNVVSVLSPSMTNEVLVSYSRLTLDNHFKDPSLLMQGAGGINFQGIFPAGAVEPVPADRPAPRLGRQRPGRQPVGEGERHVRPQRRAAVQRQADQARSARTA